MSETENKPDKNDDLWSDILSMNPELTGAAVKPETSQEIKEEDASDFTAGDEARTEESDRDEDGGRSRRKRKDPFKNMEPISSSEAALKSKDLASKSVLKQIKKAGVKHAGKKVVTDDVKILKSLSEDPDLPAGDAINFYKEPVRIEYYIPKESRFSVETRHLFIPLLDPEFDKDRFPILFSHIRQNEFFDLVSVMNENPGYITDIIEAYGNTMDLYESVSRINREIEENAESNIKKMFYLCEALIEYEPTVASLELLGPFQSWNINWMIRQANSLGFEISASDKTVSYLIKMRNIYWEEHNLEYDERFEVLAALFYEQAFPNRGLTYEEDDYFFDIFDKKR